MIRKFLHTFFTICMTLGGVSLLTGCSDEDIPYMPGADGRTTLNLLIPSTQMAYANTRAEEIANTAHGEKTADEGKIKTLAVIGFYTENNNTEKFYAELTNETATTVDAVYRSYKIAVKPAPYNLYVLANIDVPQTLKDNLKDKNYSKVSELEDAVKLLSYSYTTGSGSSTTLNLPTANNGLPMAANVKAQLSEGENKNVVIPLEFVCAKVRLSVIYDKAFGETAKFQITGSQLSDIYSPTTIFPDADNDATLGTGNKIAGPFALPTVSHYPLTTEEANMTLPQWLDYSDSKYSSSNPDPLDKLATGKQALTGTSGWTQFGWQQTAYIPQCVGKSADDITTLTLKTPKGDKSIKIGCDAEGHTGKIERGNFYDIVAMVTAGGDVTVQWKVESWTPVDMAVYLAGMSNLYLAETHICKSEPTALSGANPVEIAYETTGPALSFDIPSVDLSQLDPNITGTMPLFSVEEDSDNGVIRVTINPHLPDDLVYQGDISDKVDNSFWVISGNIRKQVVVDYIDLSKYLRILPKDMNLSISNISSTQTAPTYYFDYATNAANESTPLDLILTEYTNGNSIQYGKDDQHTSGVYLTVCDANKVALTKPIPMTVGTSINLTDTSYLLDNITEIPDDGYIGLTILNPSDPHAFAKTISGTILAEAGGLSAQAEFTINPVPLVYTIHFQTSETWELPHVYVYQPLEYNGYEVYGYSNGKNLNWLEYSFTGNMAFVGWMKDGGNETNLSGNPVSLTDGGGSAVTGYLKSDWGDPGLQKTFMDSKKYNKGVTLVDKSKSGCTSCRTAPNLLYPGYGMYLETIAGQDWWTVELPLLAKPGKALVMFSDTHNGKDDKEHRYPAGGVPGIPLPNYSDREAWFYYNPNDADHEFTDNCPSATVTSSYANKKVYVIGNFAGTTWYQEDAALHGTTDSDGYVKFTDVAINPDNEFKIACNGTFYFSGGTVGLNNWFKVGTEQNVMKVPGNNGDTYTIEWNQKEKKMKVTKTTSTPPTPTGNVTVYCIDDEGWIMWPFAISGGAPYVQLNGNGWPGTQMTKTTDSNNVIPIFSLSIPATTYKLLFHNNSDWEDSCRRQKDFNTANQSTYFAANSYFRTSGETGKITLPACGSGKKRFTAILSDDLSSEPFVYLFGGSNQNWNDESVKAQKMTHVSGRVWYYDVPTQYSNVIVRTNSYQSNNINNFSDTQIYYVEKKTD